MQNLYQLTGSPPQVRGKLPIYAEDIADYRITPAGAGKTPPFYFLLDCLKDHPRRCGENYYRRGQGKPTTRITPAGAGKTVPTIFINVAFQDHPRRCGENVLRAVLYGLRLGSPPQVRGKHCDAANCMDDCRITPAGAGKTLPSLRLRS